MITKSKHGFTRCPHCAAHVRAGESARSTVCDFCGTTITEAVRPRSVSGRGGIIAAGLLALSSFGSACSDSDPAEDNTGGEQVGDNSGDERVGDNTGDSSGDDSSGDDSSGDVDGPPDDMVPVPAYGVVPMPEDPEPEGEVGFEGEAEDPPVQALYGVSPE